MSITLTIRDMEFESRVDSARKQLGGIPARDFIKAAAILGIEAMERARFIRPAGMPADWSNADGSDANNPAGSMPTSFPDLNRQLQRYIEAERANAHVGGTIIGVPEGFGDGYALPRDFADHQRGICEFLSRPECREELHQNGRVYFTPVGGQYRRVNLAAVPLSARGDGPGVAYFANGLIRVSAGAVEIGPGGSVYFKPRQAPTFLDSPPKADRPSGGDGSAEQG